MNFSLMQIVVAIVAYLSVLFLVAWLADRGWLPRRITHHPATYVLSLGVFAGAMASNVALQLAADYGYGFLMYYLGVVLMFMLPPLLLLPLLRLCRIYQLASLADVLTFRFRSPLVGASITLAMCLTLLPLLALQIQVVADSIHILAGDSAKLVPSATRQDGLALLFCLIIIAFAILFGTRNKASQNRNTGLVTAIAFESLVKLAAMLALMLIAVQQVFGGFGGLETWLLTHPEGRDLLQRPADGQAARLLLVMFFAGAVCMPHIFHMAFAENRESQDLRAASWGLPLYLLALSLPILPLAWAGIASGSELPPGYSGLALGSALQSSAVSATAFVASLSAASATIIVTTLALANMSLNHLILPRKFLKFRREQSLYFHLSWLRRGLITVLILAGYGFFLLFNSRQSLAELGLVAFAGTLQFLPGVIVTPYWNRANRKGLLAGLAGGLGVWFTLLLLPTIGGEPAAWVATTAANWFGNTEHAWAVSAVLALGLNISLLLVVSLLTAAGDDEQVAAEICSMDELKRPARRTLAMQSVAEFSASLATALGDYTATAEVERALQELRFDPDETRPYALRRLRGRLEANLSGLLGPSVAHRTVNRCIPFQPDADDSADDLHLIERRLDQAEGQFTGFAAELDSLRRHHRQTLDNLPIGACSLAPDGEVLLWNRSMEVITGIPSAAVLGSLRDSLPIPWREVIGDFLRGEKDALFKQEVELHDGATRWISLHKTATGADHGGDQIVMVEDVSDYERLEAELLHSERLASIGRLAAGVAHEIGNPITGIACLAQNLEFETDPEELRDTARVILNQTDRVGRIVESLVNFSHAGSSSGETRLTPCNLADCVDEAVHLLQLDHQAMPIVFRNACDREQLVLADSQRLLQVFINLLSNSRDASAAGGEVRVQAREVAATVVIEVEDQGCGIPTVLQGRVFEPFFTSKEPGEGTGLGLALVYSIMEDMGGSVQLESPIADQPNPGTRISLNLPRADYAENPEPLPSATIG